MEISNNRLIYAAEHFVDMYDINKMQLITKIPCESKFIAYSKKWDMLVTKTV